MGINVKYLSGFYALIKAKGIESDSIVQKKNGSTDYKLIREIKIYNGSETNIISAEEGTVMLVSDNGNINVYPDSTEFKIYIDLNDLTQIAYDVEEMFDPDANK